MTSARPRGPRLRDHGLRIGRFDTGPANAITDVAGVAVGHVTIWRDEPEPPEGRGVARTGVTAVLPGSDRDAARAPRARGDGRAQRVGRAHRIAADRRLGMHRDARLPHVDARGRPGVRRSGRRRGRGRAACRDRGLRHPDRGRVRRQLALGGTRRPGRGRRRRSSRQRRRRGRRAPRGPSEPGRG